MGKTIITKLNINENKNSKVKSDPFYSKENQEILKRSIEQMEKTGGTLHKIEEN